MKIKQLTLFLIKIKMSDPSKKHTKHKFNCQSFVHTFDWFALPVSLTYNQHKTFKTVPGAICTIIAFFFLSLAIVINLTKYFDPTFAVFVHSTTRNLINVESPPIFSINQN